MTQDQARAKERIIAFLNDSTSTTMLLEGGAGTGKTWLVGDVLKTLHARGDVVLVAAPTHKAVNVLRRKLHGFMLPWTAGYDPYVYEGEVITGTTAQLLGIRPMVVEDQDTEVKFGKGGGGLLSKVAPRVIVIDEVSMLGWSDLKALHLHSKNKGIKLLVVGDAGQLPPVKQAGIPFEKISNRVVLTEIVRQAAGSAITPLAWSVRDGGDWASVTGEGVQRVADLRGAFLESLPSCRDNSTWKEEEFRPVFIAYTNRVVNEVQAAACQALYRHTPDAFATGEMVLAGGSLYRDRVLLCANQDELLVDKFDEDQRDPVLGVPVTLHLRSNRGRFVTHYLSPSERADPSHPYNVELTERLAQAKKFQSMVKAERGWGREMDRARKQAWKDYFEWRDTTVVTFRHPFAITSHRSQGSTYKEAFVDVGDIARHSTQALYVAVTRAKERVVMPK